jgi:UTP-glucose-1-phosphate uridylyltransferase
MGRIRRVIIPAAGLGTRLRPLTLAVPKELLPAGGAPMIGRAVWEAVEAGIHEVCVVLRHGKEVIAAYLEALGKALPVRIAVRWQPRPLGLGHALWCARDFTAGKPFLLIVPDQFLIRGANASVQLLARYRFQAPTILSCLVRIGAGEGRYFPGARGFRISPRHRPALNRGESVQVQGLVKAPADQRRNPRPRLVGFGRTIYPAEIFPYLSARYRSADTGEVDLWETFRALPETIQHRALILSGAPVDLGTREGYRRYLPLLLREDRVACGA